MGYNLVEKKCFLCGKAFLAAVPVCDACHKHWSQKEAADMALIDAAISVGGQVDPAEISRETQIPLCSVKWHLHNKSQNVSHVKKTGDTKQTGMTVSGKIYGERICIVAEGKVDSQNAQTLQTHLNELMEMGWKNIILDLNGISFFSSNGIRVVLTAYKTLYETGSFHITNPSKNVANVLGMVALDKMLLK